MLSWLEFGFGAQMQCIDGQHSKLAGLVVNPAARQLTGVIVQTGFLIGKQARIVPLSAVKRAGPGLVSLAVICDEVPQY